MTPKTLPCAEAKLRDIAARWPTPFHLYDERAIRAAARRLRDAFAWNKGFRNFFAVKAAPNPYLMRILQEEGFGADCSSLPELILAERVGLPGEAIMFTSNDTPAEEFAKAKALGANINLDDISHIPFLESVCGLPDRVCLRYNPGPLKGGNAIIGKPEEAKYGLTRDQLFEAYALLRDKGVRRFGLHTMVASNELNPQYFVDTAILLFDLAAELHERLGIWFDFINLGGGIGIPYRPEQDAVDLEAVGEGIRRAYAERVTGRGLPDVPLCFECGRCITGPAGYLVSAVRHLKHTYRDYVALAARLPFAPLPKVWQRVYTDDTFYDGRVPRGARTEAYVLAAGIALALNGANAPLPPLPGLHPEVAEELVASIREGFALRPDVLYAAERRTLPAFPVRVGDAFDAVLYDGAFERAIGDWLLRLAQADGRALSLHYTTDTDLATGVPCLYRTIRPPTAATAATLYTRPAFSDDTGREELAHLAQILAADAAKPEWIPFPLAVAEFARRLPDVPVYAGARPSEPAAAMFAAMLYLKWTGAAVLPPRCGQTETLAIAIGLDVMLRARLLRPTVNAVFCRPLGEGRYAFSLWRPPASKVTLFLSSDDLSAAVEPRALTFGPDTFWQRQTVAAPAGATLYWKIQPALPGQTTGAREVP